MSRDNRSSWRSERPTRRGFVGLAAAGFGSVLSGCSTLARSSDPFESVAVDGTVLAVTLADGVEADELELRAPDESTFVSRRIRGESELSVPLIETGYSSSPTHYQPGDHTLILRSDGDRLGEHTVALAPELEIVDLRLPTDSHFNPVVTLDNVGTGPTLLTYLGFANAPNPTPPPKETTGLDADAYPLIPVDTREVQSGSMPFAFRQLPEQAETSSCPGRLPVEVTVRTVHGDSVTETFPVRFDGELKNVLWLSHRCSDVTIDPDGASS